MSKKVFFRRNSAIFLRTLHKKMKFCIKDFFSKCEQIHSFLMKILNRKFFVLCNLLIWKDFLTPNDLFILKIIGRKKIRKSFIFPLKLWKLLLYLFFFSFFNDRFSCGMVKWRNFMFTKIHEKCMYSTSGSDSFHGQRRYDITWPFQHLPTGRTY